MNQHRRIIVGLLPRHGDGKSGAKKAVAVYDAILIDQMLCEVVERCSCGHTSAAAAITCAKKLRAQWMDENPEFALTTAPHLTQKGF